jgi:DNA helicase-2/ATP-dependent DNA helicase PcrA
MVWSDGISGVHYDIAKSGAARIAVLAGPGTGKTSFGLMRRVARLLEEGVPGDRIILLSFTRTAARDLREKVAALGVEGFEHVRATTLHSYCFSLLQRESVLVITGRTPRTLLDHEIDIMLRDIGGDFGDIFDRRRLLKAYEAGWARKQLDHPGLAEVATDRAFEQGVMKWLRHHRAMLVGEVVPLAYAFLRENPMNAEIQRFAHVLVDEYQDLNALEQQLVFELVSGPDASLCIVGDDDQSIYSFRYANPEGILGVSQDETFEQYQINVCGRCPEKILSIANSLISRAPNRNKLEMTSREGSVPGSVDIVQWADLDTEVSNIAAAIVDDIQSERFEAGDILVLVQRQIIGRSITQTLLSLDVPASSFFSQEALESSVAKERLALLRFALSDDLPSLRVLLGIGDGSARKDAYKRLADFAQKIHKPEIEVLNDALRGVKFPIRITALVNRYRQARKFIAGLNLENLESLVSTLFPNDEENIEDIRYIAGECLTDAQNAKELCARIVARISQEDVPDSPDFVRVMSLHKSKGLTSPAVHIVSALDGIIPTIRGKLSEVEIQASFDEQRRLMYVAITRAARQLVISSSRSLPKGQAFKLGIEIASNAHRDNRASTIASPYLRELGRTAPQPRRGTEWIVNRGEEPV